MERRSLLVFERWTDKDRFVKMIKLVVILLSTQISLGSSNFYPKSSDKNQLKYEDEPKDVIPAMQVSIPSRRVFRFTFHPQLFSWKHGPNPGRGYTYRPSLKGLPDLPDWMRYQYSPRHRAGFIYGVPPMMAAILELDVVALNLATFETGLLRLVLNITAQDQALNSVRLKVDNLNLEDIFDGHKLRSLKGLFKHRLWPESILDLHMTFIASSLDVGYRRPMVPTEKDGVVVQFGSNSNFSKSLLELERETSTLRSFPSCPRNFKRTSVERHFREKGFALDWCAFRVMTLVGQEYVDIRDNQTDSISVQNETVEMFEPPRGHIFLERSKLPIRNISAEFLISILPVSFVFIIVSMTFCAIFCFQRDGEEEWEGFVESFFLVFKDCFTCCSAKEKDNPLLNAGDDFRLSPELHARPRASSVQRQTDSLRRLARDVTPRLQPLETQSIRSSLQRGSVAPSIDNNTELFQEDRPAPPPYGCPNLADEDEGAYLVWSLYLEITILLRYFRALGVVIWTLWKCNVRAWSIKIFAIDKSIADTEKWWEGFVELFFLVFKDYFTCCSAKEKDNPLLNAGDDFRLSPELHARPRGASSVQRQTDSLRRLARDVTPRLQPLETQSIRSSLQRGSGAPSIDNNTELFREDRPAPPPYEGANLVDEGRVAYLVWSLYVEITNFVKILHVQLFSWQVYYY